MRILVIEDDESTREMLLQLLVRQGYEVTTARDGESGLAAFRSQPSDLVLTDLLMPGKEGLETIRELLDEFVGVKIIAMSGGGRLGNLGYLAAAEKLGANRVLAKPIDIPVLLQTIQEVLAE